MAEHGMGHRPGLADDMLQKLSPLLEADGIDLDSIDDPEQLTAALNRATEQYNLMLFTPLEANRTQTLGLLRRYAEAVAEGQDARAQRLLDAVEPDETPERPAASHLIGISFGLLDSWFADPTLKRSLGRVRIHHADRHVRAAATDLLALARKHRAFDSIDSLMPRYAGKVLMDAGSVAVAASVAAVAGSSESVIEVCRRLLLDDHRLNGVKDFSDERSNAGASFFQPGHQPGTSSPNASGATGISSMQQEELVVQFRHWLTDQDQIAAPSVEEEIALFRHLLGGVDEGGPDLQDPDQIIELFDALLDLEGSEDAETADVMQNVVGLLFDYVNFLRATADDPQVWNDVLEELDQATVAGLDSASLDELMSNLPEVSEQERHQALASTTPVSAVSDVLEWIGDRRRVTQTGGIRRNDIADFAALLGISAIGVAKQPPPPPFPEDLKFDTPLPDPVPLPLMSIWDSPVLSAWWGALQEVSIIEVNTSSVRPGRNASLWTSEQGPPADQADLLVAITVWGILTHDGNSGMLDFDAPVRQLACERLLASIAPNLIDQDHPAGFFGPRVLQQLVRLEKLGVLSLQKNGFPVIPAGLQQTIIVAASAAMSAG